MKFVRALFVWIVIESISSSAFSQTIDKKAEPKLGPIVPLGSLTIDYDFHVSFVKEPVLGPIVLIASLDEIEVAAPREITKEYAQNISESEVSAVPHPGYGAMRIISRPTAAPTPESNGPAYPLPIAALAYPASTLPQPIAILPHPDEIQFQLACIANQLMAARLPAEAARIQEFQRTFQRDHYQRLLISFKESQLHALQAEIDGLKKEFHSDNQICMHFCVVELNKAGADQLFSNSMCQNFDGGSREFDSDQIRRFTSELCASGNAKIVAEEDRTVFNGRNTIVQFNRFFNPVPAVEQIVPVGVHAGFWDSGLALRATPNCLDSSNIRVGLIIENTMRDELKVANINGAADSDPGLRHQRLSTVQDLSKGRTLGALIKPLSSQSDDADSESAKLLFILATPEVVRAYDPQDFSPYIPRPASADSNSTIPR